MSASERRQKDQAMAAHLIRIGYPHGKRQSSPRPGSGNAPPVTDTGSAAYRRLKEGKRER